MPFISLLRMCFGFIPFLSAFIISFDKIPKTILRKIMKGKNIHGFV